MTDQELAAALGKAPDWKMARIAERGKGKPPAAPEPATKEEAFRARLRAEKAAWEAISKPETTAMLHRIPVQDIPAGHEVRTIVLSGPQGIQALEDVTAHQIATYLFDRTKWTMEAATAWVEEHKPVGKAGGGLIAYHDYGTAPEADAWDAAAEIAAADVETLAKICAWADPAAPENKGSYKLPHHHGKNLEAVWKGVAAAMAALQGGRGGVDVPPTDREGIYGHLKAHYAEFEKEPPDFKKAAEPAAKSAWLGKRLIFQIRKVDPSQQICGGIIYEPNAVDTQGDMTTAAEIQKAMYAFMERYAQNPNRIKVMHKGKAFYFPVLESFQPETDIKKGTEVIKAGSWWMMIKVTDPEIWGEVKSGKLTGFSMGGTARKSSAIWSKKA